MSPERCAESWKLYMAWRESQGNKKLMKETLAAYQTHMRTCQQCQAWIKSVGQK